MFRDNTLKQCKRGGREYMPPLHASTGSVSMKRAVKTIGGLSKIIDAFSVDEIGKALSLDPSKIKVKPLKSGDGYDEEYLCIGVGSRQRSGRHILFLDLDGTTKHQAELVAKSLISSVACSDCYIIQSSVKKNKTSHHLVCLDVFTFKEVQKIARDLAHDQWAKFRGEAKDFVLRIGPKMQVMKRESHDGDTKVFMEEVEGTQPKLVSIVNSPFSYRSKSNSMRRIFSSVWGFNITKDSCFTDSTMFRFHCYRVRLKRSNGNIVKDVKFEDKPNLKPNVKNGVMKDGAE
jgi:hypothetical protein